MIKFSEIVYIDYIIKCPYNSTNNEINLQDLKLITIAHLNEKINSSYDEMDKFNKQRNIISACMDMNNQKINIIKFNNYKENNSILQNKKEVTHLNLAPNDNLDGNNRIELPKIGAKKLKKFKKISVNNLNQINTNTFGNKNKGVKIQKYTYEEDEDNDSKQNSHRIDNNYSNDSYSKYKDSKLNTIGKATNDFNVNEINRIGSDLEILRAYKDKQISPSTAATEKSYYNGLTNSRRILNDSELGRNLSNLK